jgi:uncharacterized membrane protein YuzA (DUF378 family)
MNGIAKAALALVIVDALNWLLVGVFRFHLVAAIFGNMTVLARAVYAVVGLAGLYCLTLLFRPTPSAARVPENYRRAA